ncbi:SAP domain protein [Leptospira perolatii]|uniref:SAP domain protein n=1 Tax=Leptospira perolatii TaxID=2023191 RepID=A0A2M9ZSX5_9LEPT|nr:SAP domain protein [Leptospira perolatii]PJZ75180.1 SAP domain protein [Leptospira perolatii]
MKKRPHFSKIKTREEFEIHYWYREELAQICKEEGIPAHGSKVEMENRLKSYLQSNRKYTTNKEDESKVKASQRRSKSRPTKITLNSKILPEGIRFDSIFREFCRNHYGLKKFNFTMYMARAVREAEKQGNTKLTVKDLLKIYENPPTKITPDDRVLRWNTFVKDFHKDSKTKDLKNKLEVAAFLWAKLRDRPGSKKYVSDLLIEFQKDVFKISNLPKTTVSKK